MMLPLLLLGRLLLLICLLCRLPALNVAESTYACIAVSSPHRHCVPSPRGNLACFSDIQLCKGAYRALQQIAEAINMHLNPGSAGQSIRVRLTGRGVKGAVGIPDALAVALLPGRFHDAQLLAQLGCMHHHPLLQHPSHTFAQFGCKFCLYKVLSSALQHAERLPMSLAQFAR